MPPSDPSEHLYTRLLASSSSGLTPFGATAYIAHLIEPQGFDPSGNSSAGRAQPCQG